MGATSGIGKEVATLLAAQGWLVGIAGRRENLLVQIEKENENIICHRRIDVNEEDAPGLLYQLIQSLGGMDMYVHSSGIGWQNTELETSRELATVTTNCLGFTRMTDSAFNWLCDNADLKAKTGIHRHKTPDIVCITSIAGTKGLGAAPAYSAAKRFQRCYIEALAQLAEIRHTGIRILEVRPGFVNTDLISNARYPMKMKTTYVARKIVNAINHGKSVVTIDWRYAALVALWSMLPRCLWTRLRIK